jgi:hypothetical protein
VYSSDCLPGVSARCQRHQSPSHILSILSTPPHIPGSVRTLDQSGPVILCARPRDRVKEKRILKKRVNTVDKEAKAQKVVWETVSRDTYIYPPDCLGLPGRPLKL